MSKSRMDPERLPERVNSVENRLQALEYRVGLSNEESRKTEERIISHLERIARLEERFAHLPTREQAARLEERIARLPSTTTVVALGGLFIAISVAILSNLPRIQHLIGLPISK